VRGYTDSVSCPVSVLTCPLLTRNNRLDQANERIQRLQEQLARTATEATEATTTIAALKGRMDRFVSLLFLT
jgi:hypothetical protein